MEPNISIGNITSEGALPAQSNWKKGMTQIFETILFEFQRNLKKLLILCIIAIAIFILTVVMAEYNYSQGQPLPEESKNFVSGQLSFLPFFIYIAAVALGASAIAVDFEKLTGNLLFPYISRSRLMIGRIIGIFLMMILILSLWFMGITSYTLIKYSGKIPLELGSSFGMTLLFGLTVVSFVIFMSSWSKSVQGASIFAILLLILGFDLVSGIYTLMTKGEAIFSLTYYAAIIQSVIDMPEKRYIDQSIPITEGQVFEIRTWLTPSIEGALIGMAIYLTVSLLLSFIIFYRRQMVN